MLILSMIAMIALLLQSPRGYPDPAILLIAAAIALAYFLPWRLSGGGVIPWLLRGTAFGVLILTAPESRMSVRFWYLDEAIMSLMGMLLGAELAMQHYLPVRAPHRMGIMLVAAAGVMLAASTTYQTTAMAILAPLYALVSLSTLSLFKPPTSASPSIPLPAPARSYRRWMLQGGALMLAMVLGFASIDLVHRSRQQMMNWGVNWLLNMVQLPHAGVNPNEQLGPSLTTAGQTTRTLRIKGINRVMYLRGLAFDTYHQGAWLPVLSRRQMAGNFAAMTPPASARTFRIERLDDSNGILYLPLNTPGFRVPAEATTEAEPGHRATVLAVDARSNTLTYEVAAADHETDQGPLCRTLSDEEKSLCLAVPPELDAGVHRIANELKRDEPVAQIREVVRYLQDHHEYSLDSEKGEGEPISDFLLNGRSAHCQYFAAAATMLLRINGVPCRYVIGYFAHESSSDDSMVVRQRDAHAWVEAFVEGAGWITVEATPASGTPDALASRDTIPWYQRLRERLADAFSAAGDFFRSLQWYQIAFAGASLVLVALSVQAIRNRRLKRQRSRDRAYAFPAEEYRRLAARFEAILRRMGDAPAGSNTWSEYLRQQSALASHRRHRRFRLEAARRFVEAYNQARFGSPSDPAALNHLRRLLDEVAHSRASDEGDDPSTEAQRQRKEHS